MTLFQICLFSQGKFGKYYVPKDTNDNNDQIQIESSAGELSSGSNTKNENKMAPSDSEPLKEKDEIQLEDKLEITEQASGQEVSEEKDEVKEDTAAPGAVTPDPSDDNPVKESAGSAEQSDEPVVSTDPSKDPLEQTSDPDVKASSDAGEYPNKETIEAPVSDANEPSTEQESSSDKPETFSEDVQEEDTKDPSPEKVTRGGSPGSPAEEISASESDEPSAGEVNIIFDYSTLSREDLINRLDVLLEANNMGEIRSDVDNIKLNYYKKFKLETEQLRRKYVEEGGNIDDFNAPEDKLESRLKDLLKKFKAHKADENKKSEHQRQLNLEKKYEVIERIKDLINRKESINKTFQEFRDLQKEWRFIGLVPQPNVKELWDTYNHHIEKFYDYIKINKELRDLDFKKNMEFKIRLCEKAEQLILEPSVINAFNSLQKYHDQWREIGPVPPEIRTEIWDRFKEATTKINKKHQQHYSDLKKEQKNNFEQKRIICEQAEEISNLVISTHKEWEDKSRDLIELQRVWRAIGFAPKKDNNKIYQRFRTACDQFFNRKREFYAQNKETQMNNLQLKTDLCIQAETAQKSNEWKKTTEDLINLQKQWKKIGPVPKKQSDQVWKRFRSACDLFFERKAKYYNTIDQTYEDNLNEKVKLLKEIEEFQMSGNLDQDFRRLNEFQRRWTDIGFVPFKEKEDIQDKYRVAVNKHYDNLKIDDNKKNMLKFSNRVNNILQKPKSDLKLNQEREKFIIRLQQLKSDIVLWENNIGFFAKTKNAQSMIDEVNNKIENARQTIQLLESKIEMLDNLGMDNN